MNKHYTQKTLKLKSCHRRKKEIIDIIFVSFMSTSCQLYDRQSDPKIMKMREMRGEVEEMDNPSFL